MEEHCHITHVILRLFNTQYSYKNICRICTFSSFYAKIAICIFLIYLTQTAFHFKFVSMMSNYYNAFLYMLIHYLHLHIIAYESIRRKKMPLICHNSRAYCPVVSQIYKLRYLRYWHHLPNLIQWHSGNLILTLIHHFLK